MKGVSAMLKLRKLAKRILSTACAAAIFVCNALPLTAFAEEPEYAHTVPVFDVSVKNGADYHAVYSSDKGDDLEKAYVWEADKAADGHKFVYNIKLSVSGEGTSNKKPEDMTDEELECSEAVSSEGFITIRIPAHILRFKTQTDGKPVADANGVYPDEIELPVPSIDQIPYTMVAGKKVYSTNHQFVYRYDAETDEYVIYNIKAVSAGVVYELPVAYKMNKNTWEYKDLAASYPFSAHLELKTWKKDSMPSVDPEVYKEDTRQIPVYIDTGAEILSSKKSASATLITAAEAMSKTGLTDLDDHYRYTIWAIASKISNVTQKYNINLSDSTTGDLTGYDAGTETTQPQQHTVKGEVYAINVGSGYKLISDADAGKATDLSASGMRTDYVLTRYPYDDIGTDGECIEDLLNAPKDATYTASNDASVEVEPRDGRDNSTAKPSSASFKFDVKDPRWEGPAEKYTADKYGLYNNGATRVSNKNNISSYDMSKLDSGSAISGLVYETETSAYAYGNTVADLNHKISSMQVPKTIGQDGSVTIVCGAREYLFNENNTDTFTVTVGGASHTVAIEGISGDKLTMLAMKQLAGEDIAKNVLGQRAVEYALDDKTLRLIDLRSPSEPVTLDSSDYRIDFVDYQYLIKGTEYDSVEMKFSEGDKNVFDPDDNNVLQFWAYVAGSDTPVLVGEFDVASGEARSVDSSLVKGLTASRITFADNANVTGYRISTSNKYYYVRLNSRPSVTLLPSAKVAGVVHNIIEKAAEKKVAVSNTANWSVSHSGSSIYNKQISGTDYVADIVRNSSISKQAQGEKNSFKGQDGNIYKSVNDTLNGNYQLAWKTTVKETADGVEVGGEIKSKVPVKQQSGVFYDLLPAHCDIIEGSVNVYVDADGDITPSTQPLSPSSFEVLERIDNYNNTGKKLLVVKVNAPCEKSYTLTYVTVHTHDDIQDYGSIALNTVAYQTGNPDIGGGYPDNGGNYAVSMSDHIKNLDPDNGTAKRFIYAESTEDILALFPTSSGIYKKVATASEPIYDRSAKVHNNETYSYSIRMQNDSTTRAFDIAILDSIENYRTVGGIHYNYGINRDRDWHGTLESIDLSGVESKIADYAKDNPSTSVNDLKLLLYVGEGEDDIVDLNGDLYSDSSDRKNLLKYILRTSTSTEGMTTEQIEEANKWQVVNDWRSLSGIDLANVSAFAVYTGENFMLGKDESLSFTVKMRAPANVEYDASGLDVENGQFLAPPSTFNNIYRSFRSVQYDDPSNENYFYTHYDYTQVQYCTVGTLSFKKADSKSGEGVSGVEFRLSGISDYGTPYNEQLISDNSGMVTFMNLERGTYTLVESSSDPDHLLDPAPRTVTVDPQGVVTIVTVDGVVIENQGKYSILNAPRSHGEFEFTKADLITGKGVSGAVFRLTGVSDHNTSYDLTATSDSTGKVSFGDIEKGTYTLKEEITPDGYVPPVNNTYTVTGSGDHEAIFTITGENVVSTLSEQKIYNEPFAEMKVHKVDSISNKMLDNAKFTLTASDTLDEKISNAVDKLTAQNNGKTAAEIAEIVRWQDQDGKWVQIIDGSNSSVAGEYLFKNLPEGTYTLKETAPSGYTSSVDEYTVTVEKNSTGYVITFSPETKMQYIKLEDGEFVTTTKTDAQYYRLLNDQVYEDSKTVIKSWIGGTIAANKFPVFHLSTEEPQVSAVKVTIGNNLKTLIQANKTKVTGFVRETTCPDNASFDGWTDNDDGETGKFYAWWDSSDNKIHWWSDANVIYLPSNCEFLFSGLNSKNIEIDLSAFDFSKVTSMKGMFASTTNIDGKGSERTKISKITFPSNIDTSNVTNMEGLFWGCNLLTELDLTGFDTAKVNSMSTMFKNCSSLVEIKLDPKKFTDDSLTSVFRMFDECNALKQIDLRGFKGEKLTTAQSWFSRCYKLDYIDLSNFIDGSQITIIKYIFEYLGKNTTKGCAIFSNKWMLNDISTSNPNNADSFVNDQTRLNLYGTTYTNTNLVSVYDNANFDIAVPAEGGGTTSLSGVKANRYFNDPNGDYYTDFFDEEYRNLYTTETATNTTASPTVVTFENYPDFTKDGMAAQTENETATEDDIGKTTFSFEYVTGSEGTKVDDTTYTVEEKIYLTVTTIIKQDDKFYNSSQKYVYDKPVTAKWTQVTRGGNSQWYCKLTVHDGDDKFFCWEDTIKDYKSTADSSNPIITKGRADEPIITNSTTPVGTLVLSKTLTGTTSEKYSQDEFWFKVTMKKSDNTTPYTTAPFDANGVAYFKVRANAAQEDVVKIMGIPEGSKYTVEEVNETTHPMPQGYQKQTTAAQAGTIVADHEVKAEIENSILTKDLSISKTAKLYRIVDGVKTEVTDEQDNDLEDWKAQSFTFTVELQNLVKGEQYSVFINGTEQPDKIVGSSTGLTTSASITLKPGQTAVIKDIPQGSTYNVTENSSSFTDTDEEKYEVSYTIGSGAEVTGIYSTGSSTLNDDAEVAFTNIKTINKPETVSVTVSKSWYNEAGELVTWSMGPDGKAVSSEGNYPSFLKVYLGRALKTTENGEDIFFDMDTGYTSYSLKANENWTYEFEDLPKSATAWYKGVEKSYEYVYFVTEMVPLGYHNSNSESEQTTISSGSCFVATGTGNDLSFELKNQKDPTYELTVSKLVTGNMGSKTDEFKFEISFEYNGEALTGTGLTMEFTDENDPTYYRNRTYTLESGKVNVSLPHGKSVKFLSIPKNTKYTIREFSENYTVTSGTYTEAKASDADKSTLTGADVQTGTLTADTKYLFVNDRTVEIPTGITLNSMIPPFALLVSLGYLFIRNKRKERRQQQEQ